MGSELDRARNAVILLEPHVRWHLFVSVAASAVQVILLDSLSFVIGLGSEPITFHLKRVARSPVSHTLSPGWSDGHMVWDRVGK